MCQSKILKIKIKRILLSSFVSGILAVCFLTALKIFQCLQPDFFHMSSVVKGMDVLNSLLCCLQKKNFQTDNDGYYLLRKQYVLDGG
jgi:hypothetical protein